MPVCYSSSPPGGPPISGHNHPPISGHNHPPISGHNQPGLPPPRGSQRGLAGMPVWQEKGSAKPALGGVGSLATATPWEQEEEKALPSMSMSETLKTLKTWAVRAIVIRRKQLLSGLTLDRISWQSQIDAFTRPSRAPALRPALADPSRAPTRHRATAGLPRWTEPHRSAPTLVLVCVTTSPAEPAIGSGWCFLSMAAGLLINR
jgi:hypothetical protein